MSIYRIRFSDHSMEGPLPSLGRGDPVYGIAVNLTDSRERWFVAGRQWRRWSDLSLQQRLALRQHGLEH